MPFIEEGKILRNEAVKENVWEMEIFAERISLEASCGQFVQVECSKDLTPLLRKPLSISDISTEKNTITLLYQVKGTGTKKLKEKLPGEQINLLGPLGEGFKLQEDKEKVLVIGGGIGVAPLLALVRELAELKKDITVILGFNSGLELLKVDYFADKAKKVLITTMDGSCGIKGHVCTPFEEQLNIKDFDIVYSCGPEKMLAAVQNQAKKAGISCQLSLEAYMACGIGACLGCICKTQDKNGDEDYSRVCVEGPVFEGWEVLFDE